MRKPKPVQLTYQPWPDPEPHRLYPGRITGISAKKESVCVTVKNLDKTMAGRPHHAEVPKCLHPGNRTKRFAAAAGLDVVSFGEEIDLRDAIGATIGMRFIPIGDDYEIEFERITAEDAAKKDRTGTRSLKAWNGDSAGELGAMSESHDDSLPYREDAPPRKRAGDDCKPLWKRTANSSMTAWPFWPGRWRPLLALAPLSWSCGSHGHCCCWR